MVFIACRRSEMDDVRSAMNDPLVHLECDVGLVPALYVMFGCDHDRQRSDRMSLWSNDGEHLSLDRSADGTHYLQFIKADLTPMSKIIMEQMIVACVNGVVDLHPNCEVFVDASPAHVGFGPTLRRLFPFATLIATDCDAGPCFETIDIAKLRDACG